MTTNSIATMSDTELIGATARAAGDERRITTELLALLAELDARRLYLGEGCSSLFTYCTKVLHFSEHAAYHRIETARAARFFPVILEMIADGSITTTTVGLLRPHLTAENRRRLLGEACHKTRREVEQQVAALAPKPHVALLVRRLPESRLSGKARDVKQDGNVALAGAMLDVARPEATPQEASGFDATPLEAPVQGASALRVSKRETPSPDPRSTIAPLATDRYLLRITLSAEGHANLRRAQSLIRRTVPNGDPAAVVERALALFVAHLERQKAALTSRPITSTQKRIRGASSRHIPASVRREVWSRDGGRCAFVGPHGRCTETGRLEFHHVVPFARCGDATTNNIALRCRAHNAHEGEACFGIRGRAGA